MNPQAKPDTRPRAARATSRLLRVEPELRTTPAMVKLVVLHPHLATDRDRAARHRCSRHGAVNQGQRVGRGRLQVPDEVARKSAPDTAAVRLSRKKSVPTSEGCVCPGLSALLTWNRAGVCTPDSVTPSVGTSMTVSQSETLPLRAEAARRRANRCRRSRRSSTRRAQHPGEQ